MQPERVALVTLGQVSGVGPDGGETVKLRGHVARPSVGPVGGNLDRHPGEKPVGILITRRIDAIRSQVLSAS